MDKIGPICRASGDNHEYDGWSSDVGAARPSGSGIEDRAGSHGVEEGGAGQSNLRLGGSAASDPSVIPRRSVYRADQSHDSDSRPDGIGAPSSFAKAPSQSRRLALNILQS